MFWGKIKEISRIVREVGVSEIIVPEGRFRRISCDESLKSLAESIREHGIIEPLIVRRTVSDSPASGDSAASYTLIAGERRLRAAEMIGLTTVPTVSIEAGEVEAAILAIIENLHREDLSIFEEAASIQSLISLTGMTQEMCARKLSVSQSYIANKLRLLRLSAEEQEMILSASLTERHSRALLRLDEGEERMTALKKIIERSLNVSQTEEYVEDLICAKSRLAERESKPDKSEQKRKLIIRDIRLFYNSIDHAVDVIKKSGIPVESSRKEVENGVLISILLPRRAG
ncbi:MAG: ParB/RepB/Spo0J family partition protein [Eubacteriales bacterium]